MSDVKWIKVVTDVFDDEKILLIETLSKADSIIVIWFKLLCLAGKQNNNGTLIMNDKIAYTDKMLASVFRRSEKLVKQALNVFEQYGMIEIIDNVITIPNWEKHQNIDGLQKIREQTKNRVQKHREKQKEKLSNVTQNGGNDTKNVTCNVTVTQCNETEEDKNKNNKKEKTNFDIILSESDFNETTRERLKDFIKMRKTIKKPLTDRALKLIISKLRKYSKTEEEMQKILDNSIVNSWQNVYELKPEEKKEFKKKEYKENTMSEKEYYQKMKGQAKKYE